MAFNFFTLRRHNPARATCMCRVVNARTCRGSKLLSVTETQERCCKIGADMMWNFLYKSHGRKSRVAVNIVIVILIPFSMCKCYG